MSVPQPVSRRLLLAGGALVSLSVAGACSPGNSGNDPSQAPSQAPAPTGPASQAPAASEPASQAPARSPVAPSTDPSGNPFETGDPHEIVSYKPVLYLYPERESQLEVVLDFDGTLRSCYPEPHRQGHRATWLVTATPEGTLTDSAGRHYGSLFWDGVNPSPMRQEEGFIVEPGQAVSFLEDTLAVLGLTELEAAELITFWAPRLQERGPSLVTFAAEQQAQIARYTFTDTTTGQQILPDTFIRVYMLIGQVPMTPVPEQVLAKAPARTGLTVVEWGGAEQ